MTGQREGQAGKPARKIGRGWEIIGPTECPLLYRRTLVACRWFKVLWHRFVPNASDEAAHDHPRSFLTVVLRGSYRDEALCLRCEGEGFRLPDDSPCSDCDGTGRILDVLTAPAIRFRRAEHAHITRVGPDGATTLCIMGPLRREWGFWRDGKWYEWRRFERLFGLNWRCP